MLLRSIALALISGKNARGAGSRNSKQVDTGTGCDKILPYLAKAVARNI